ncbi:MAG: type II toxin-antitoxin system RelE/ParE family toxin [Gammaproteobacteria bacterium]|nr:MAG: type II toxin-antitoxin system RelE/ParE family toxin [Gammaproteobacteria bacterium]RLA59593.1 MAG: type II toxin-antitoxin system RelE/ParE family toxin [Gammaproteobacteria bacterium]
MKVVFLKIAEAELDHAVEYYESKQPQLGLRFRREVLRSLRRIVEYPTAFALLGHRSRRCLVAKFPYGVIYQHKQETSEILIIAVAHLHRKPDYWLSHNLEK